MNIPVIRAVQKGVTLYIGKMKAATLLEIGIVTEWDPDLGWDLSRQGYQREPNEEHCKRLGRFLFDENDPLLPTSALLSAREAEEGVLQFDYSC